jgi:putative aldouronate transport system substrate-binding protein
MTAGSASRRDFLRLGALGLALPLLTACGAVAPTGATPPAARPGGGGVGKLPTYLPVQSQQPDLPGSADGLVSPGWIAYPKQLFQSVKDPPGAGGAVSLTLQSSYSIPPFDQNGHWQAVAKALNAKLDVTLIPFSDFDVKWAALQAGNDLPDLMCTITRPQTPIVPAFLEAKCQDLTPYLAGDAIRDYPNLAALPTRAWKSTLINGRLYGVPYPLRPYFWWFWGHQEILDQAGLAYPKSAAEFKETALKLNKPQQNVWAIGSEAGAAYAFSTVNGLWNAAYKAPNYWSVDANGKFTYVFETEQYRQAMDYAADLVRAGLYHPKTLAYNTTTARLDFMARQMIFRFDGLQSSPYWGGFNARPMDPPSHITLVPPFSADGRSRPVYYFGRPNFGIALVKKAGEARVKEMLRILNYIAAPFGSTEFQLLWYGVEGRDFTFDDQGNPTLTELGKVEISPTPCFGSLTQPAPYYYSPADPGAPAIYQGYEKLLGPLGVEDASIGCFSPTFAAKGSQLLDGVGGGAQDIIAGRRPPSEWGDLVKAWQSGGGNQIKAELAQAYAALNG